MAQTEFYFVHFFYFIFIFIIIVIITLPKIEYLDLWQTDFNTIWTCVYRRKLLFFSTASALERSGRCDGSIVASTTATAIARTETELDYILSSSPKIEYLDLWQTNFNKLWTCVYRRKLLLFSTASALERSGRSDGSIVEYNCNSNSNSKN